VAGTGWTRCAPFRARPTSTGRRVSAGRWGGTERTTPRRDEMCERDDPSMRLAKLSTLDENAPQGPGAFCIRPGGASLFLALTRDDYRR